MVREVRRCPALKGAIVPPGDKSISHRAAILNGIAEGKARLTNFSPGGDCHSTLKCLRAIGVGIEQLSADPYAVEVTGVGRKGFVEAADILDAGNSGTTMRLMTGLLAAQPFLSVITGDSSLRSRPMGRLILPLRLMGSKIWGRGRDTLAPLAIKGQELRGVTYSLPVASAQIKSAILIAAIFATQGKTTIQEPSRSRDHTERLLQAMGLDLTADDSFVTLSPLRSPPVALDMAIPGDISSAAYWMVLGAAHPSARIEIKGVGVNPTRTGIVDVLRAMGANLRVENERTSGSEPVADIVVESSRLTGTTIAGHLVPRLIDEIPALAIAASVARGTTVISDAAELRVKETDRIRLMAEGLSKFGVTVEEKPDGMVIDGGATLHGALCSSHHDHRLAMSLGIAGALADGVTLIEDAEVADISYPDFWQHLEMLKAG
ncbi:MAG: 3-phosphoshikimate 1-carboxyvinyltransferase [Chloroflexi bacterium RBG_13_60_13]|nr:MAG: 3-phosphoshikimate 1-carboxyvinyltransferase [Chloroflexi bacterium RBG_13_60_13]